MRIGKFILPVWLVCQGSMLLASEPWHGVKSTITFDEEGFECTMNDPSDATRVSLKEGELRFGSETFIYPLSKLIAGKSRTAKREGIFAGPDGALYVNGYKLKQEDFREEDRRYLAETQEEKEEERKRETRERSNRAYLDARTQLDRREAEQTRAMDFARSQMDAIRSYADQSRAFQQYVCHLATLSMSRY